MKPKTDSTRLLVTVYGIRRHDEALIALGQGYVSNQKDMKPLILEVINRIPKKDRQREFKKYIARKVNKIWEEAPQEIRDAATVLEVPKEQRLKYFGDDIVLEYKNGTALYLLAKHYGLSNDKVRQHLVDNGIKIRRGRGGSKKK